ncbi:MAG: hypothetical protein HZB65_00210 [Candidatus Aenigmarchaeota archaeon]|nr:hypothetical protein [Candidatus Aenigmarchaeota archaeon]
MAENIVVGNESALQKKSAMVWQVLTAVFIILFVASIFTNGFGITGAATAGESQKLSIDDAEKKVVDYVSEVVGDSSVVKILDSKDADDLYSMRLNIDGHIYDSYVTKDGRLLFPSAVDLTQPVSASDSTASASSEIAKSDRPEAKAFIMSYCPYGLQFMKAYIPVMELLGDKADLSVNFVDYAMHGKKEIDENTRMYCIQKEQKEKFTVYLRCFVEKDDYQACMKQAGVDESKLNICVNATDTEFNVIGLYNDKGTWSGGQFPQYPVEKELNQKYEVQGSPTFVLNGEQADVDRSANAMKQAVCNAFNNPPVECSQTLSTTPENPGIGAIGSGNVAAGSGSCG